MTEKNEMKPNNLSLFFLVVAVLIFIILLMGIFLLIQNNISLNNNNENIERARLDTEIYNWGFNEYNDEELIFDYWIYNYGNKEAKNVKVEILVYDEQGIEVASFIDDYGNLASNSVEFREFFPLKTDSINYQDVYSIVSYVKSCDDDCEILWKNIPRLVQMFE